MPEGIEVSVADGFAVIEFTDPTRRGPGLTALLDTGVWVEKQTGGPRSRYRTTEEAARAAGLLDTAKPPHGDTVAAVTQAAEPPAAPKRPRARKPTTA